MATFIKSAANKTQYIHDKKVEICFIGRSNVGKSSLINSLAKEKIARTSNTPGRTQLVNFFDFDKYRLVDLPGYGYASVSKQQKENLVYMIEEYLLDSKNLIAVFQICDINVQTRDDAEMSRFFQNKFPNHFIILNKTDKVNKSHFDNSKTKIANFLGISKDRLFPISALKNENTQQLKTFINTLVIDHKKKQMELNNKNESAE